MKTMLWKHYVYITKNLNKKGFNSVFLQAVWNCLTFAEAIASCIDTQLGPKVPLYAVPCLRHLFCHLRSSHSVFSSGIASHGWCVSLVPPATRSLSSEHTCLCSSPIPLRCSANACPFSWLVGLKHHVRAVASCCSLSSVPYSCSFS